MFFLWLWFIQNNWFSFLACRIVGLNHSHRKNTDPYTTYQVRLTKWPSSFPFFGSGHDVTYCMVFTVLYDVIRCYTVLYDVIRCLRRRFTFAIHMPLLKYAAVYQYIITIINIQRPIAYHNESSPFKRRSIECIRGKLPDSWNEFGPLNEFPE